MDAHDDQILSSFWIDLCVSPLKKKAEEKNAELKCHQVFVVLWSRSFSREEDSADWQRKV